MKVDGKCHCGEVTYAAQVDPRTGVVCHCTDCQTMGSGPYRTLVVGSGLKLLSGKPTVYVKTAESGNKRALTCESA